MGNTTGLIVAILVAVLGFFGWKSLDTQIDQLQGQIAEAGADGEAAAQLLQRIETIESEAGPKNAASDATNANNAADMEALLMPVMERIETLESQQSPAMFQSANSASNTASNTATLIARIEALEAAASAAVEPAVNSAPSPAVQQRLDALEQAMDSIGQDLGEEVLDPLMIRVESLEAAVASQAGSSAQDGDPTEASLAVNALMTRLDAVETTVAELASLSQRLDALEVSLADTNSLQGRLAAVESVVGNQAGDGSSAATTPLIQRLGSLESAVGGIQPGLSSALGPLDERIAAVESVVGSQADDGDSVPTASLIERLGSLESAVGGIQPDLSSALAPLDDRLAAVENAVTEIEPGIGQQSLVPLMQRIQEVEKAVGGAIASAGSQTDDNLIAGGFEFVDSEIVYFGYNSATPENDGLEALKKFADQITTTSKIVIRGYADSRGSNIYNQNLALRRALNTEKVLVTRLRDRNIYRNQIIALESAGEESQLVETGDNVESAENRAVKITLYE